MDTGSRAGALRANPGLGAQAGGSEGLEGSPFRDVKGEARATAREEGELDEAPGAPLGGSGDTGWACALLPLPTGSCSMLAGVPALPQGPSPRTQVHGPSLMPLPSGTPQVPVLGIRKRIWAPFPP